MSTVRDPGEWLRDRMEHRNLSTRDVAEAVGLRDQAVYYWLTGRTAPKDDAATKLAAVLDVPEVEVRRRFGLWVPEDSEPQPARDAAELDEILQELTSVLEKFRRWRSGV